jgi:hypothetical protein
MISRTWFIATPALLVIALLAVSLARGQSAGDNDGFNNPISGATTVFSRVRIIDLDDTVFRLDTDTGQLSRFRGTLTGRNARGTFVSVAPPLRDPTSGFVDIQQAGGAIFLVDRVTGQTWILRQRSSSNAAWIEVSTPD